MDYNINYLVWKVLCWNIKGLNADDKQIALYNKIVESGCAVACIQGTKKEMFERNFIKKCCPRQFDSFAFAPSVGAPGGILVLWKSSIFYGNREICSCSGYIIYLSQMMSCGFLWVISILSDLRKIGTGLEVM